MKRSVMVGLVLSGTLLSGCSKKQTTGVGGQWSDDDSSEVLTNNTYRNGHYWHAPYRAWYPLPYNFYSLDRGYYHGGSYSANPDQSGIVASKPPSSRVTPSQSRYVSRGGFGSSSHTGS